MPDIERQPDGSYWLKGSKFWHYAYNSMGCVVEIYSSPERHLSNFLGAVVGRLDGGCFIRVGNYDGMTAEQALYLASVLEDAAAIASDWGTYVKLLTEA